MSCYVLMLEKSLCITLRELHSVMLDTPLLSLVTVSKYGCESLILRPQTQNWGYMIDDIG